MALVNSRAYFDRFQVDTTGTTLQPLRSYMLRPQSAFRFEIVLEASDGGHMASFRRVLTVKRDTGAPEVVGRFWHCSETTRSHPAFDVRAVMNEDGSFSLWAKNASEVKTTWKAHIERLAISR